MNQPSPIKRRVSRQIQVGDVPIGGDAPIAVQSMTNTETCDVEATVAQIHAIAAYFVFNDDYFYMALLAFKK